MPDEVKMLFQSDPERFWQIVANDEAEQRVAAMTSAYDMLLCEVLRYGIQNKEDMVGPLVGLYRMLSPAMPEEGLFTVYRHVAGFVENTSIVSTNAFLPFIAEETSMKIVSTAVIDYVSLGPLTGGDPMSRVKDIVGMIETNRLKNEGAAFGGLLHVGDKRVCDLLIPLRDNLDSDALNIAVKCSTGFVNSATVDFYLDWLEGMEGSGQDRAFGIAASGLALLKKTCQFDYVAIGHRPFPTRGTTLEQWSASQTPISFAEYAQRISRRMHDLERAEPPPRVMPHVLMVWGLQPLTDPAEAVSLG